jgi:hypothetical protein
MFFQRTQSQWITDVNQLRWACWNAGSKPLVRRVNVSYTMPHEPSSSGIPSTIQKKKETLLKYIHPILSEDRKHVVLEVECGSNKGLLYLSRLCRGSRGACILYQKTWLTPNQFQAVSGRDTAKDWKRSIRHRGRSMKLLMSKGILPQNSHCQYQTNADISTTFHVSTLFVMTLVKILFGPLFLLSDVCVKWNLTCTRFLFIFGKTSAVQMRVNLWL